MIKRMVWTWLLLAAWATVWTLQRYWLGSMQGQAFALQAQDSAVQYGLARMLVSNLFWIFSATCAGLLLLTWAGPLRQRLNPSAQ